MTGNKFIAIIAAIVAIGAALAVAGLYLDWQRMFAPPAVEQGPVAGVDGATVPAEPETATPSGEPPKPQAEATGALTPPAEPTFVPTFDVVVIEPSGEGVIAGRAAPGWQVSVQSGGTKVAEARADVQGEWSVVLAKPLPAGDHALSLKITSPDGTRALTSQESVRVAVGADEKKGNAPAGAVDSAGLAASTAPQAAVVVPEPAAQTDASTAPAPAQPEAARAGETQALTRAEQGAASPPSTGGEQGAPPPPKPKLVFKTVDYEDSGSGTGTVTITGTSDPGARISIYYGNEPLAEARADRQGQWRVAIEKKLGMGQHSFRAERADAAAGMLAAMVTIERAAPKPEPPPAEVAANRTPPGSASQVATVEGPNGQTSGDSSGVYVIRPGDTLWAIAKRYLGSGLRYTSIFQDNRTIIRNPNLIHPKQEVKVPTP
ncbi:MAG: LysM peptidoglycan-binding domain-containing protein [Methyloceanibacter sp.]|nr:LysM peptidoglycan-binding domain-containing protein [Methyloceanibacter sp.]